MPEAPLERLGKIAVKYLYILIKNREISIAE